MNTSEATTPGRTARWLLLFCTLFGLATMHTLGHAGMRMAVHEHGGEPMVAAGPAVVGMGSGEVKVLAALCPEGHCDDPHGSGMGGWSVCLAVLGGVVSAVLLMVALGTRTGASAAARGVGAAGPPVSRAPPRWPGHGLRVASLVVQRI